MAKPKDIDDYLRTVQDDQRAALQRLRQQLTKLLPKAEECISYSMPAFRTPGGVVAGFLATKKGCSYFPFSGTTLRTVAEATANYSQTKSALHFDPAKGLPLNLVRTLVHARMAEMTARPSAARKAAKNGAAPPRKRAGTAARTPKARDSSPGTSAPLPKQRRERQ
jgi:uncharacterized protein YdhG (YjbR/CyaY superfamily)